MGVFDGFKKDPTLADFKKFNVIYGLNGSGKTTLAEFIRCLNLGANSNFTDLKYSIN